jgi:hypothetical protein
MNRSQNDDCRSGQEEARMSAGDMRVFLHDRHLQIFVENSPVVA